MVFIQLPPYMDWSLPYLMNNKMKNKRETLRILQEQLKFVLRGMHQKSDLKDFALTSSQKHAYISIK